MKIASIKLVGGFTPVLVALLLVASFLMDQMVPQAGAWALVGLTLTAGFVHGALDAALLQRRFRAPLQLMAVLTGYLLAVVFLGWLLGSMLNAALWLLILMSVWHFGESYGRWSNLAPRAANLTRAVVGGAPVLLPVWLAPDAFARALAPIVDTLAVDVWRPMAVLFCHNRWCACRP